MNLAFGDRSHSYRGAKPQGGPSRHPIFANTLGGGALLRGRASIQYDSWLRPTRFAAPEALLGEIVILFQCLFRRKQDC